MTDRDGTQGDGGRRISLDGWAPDVVAVVAGLVAVHCSHKVVGWLSSMIDERQGALYGALLGLHATLLGFILASLTIVLGYINNPNFLLVRESGHFKSLFGIFIAGTRTEALACIAALAALVVDTKDHSHPTMAAVVTASTLLAVLRLLRTLWVLRLVVLKAVEPTERKAGA